MARILVMGDARSVHIERWCRYFADDGFDVALFSLEPKTISVPVRFYPAKRRTSIGMINYRLAKKDFFRALDDFRPDIVSAHYVVSYGWLASYCNRCPVIVTAWGSDLLILPQRSFIHRRRAARALKHAAYCSVDSTNLHKAAARFIAEDKILRLVMGVDRTFFNSAALAGFRNSGPLRILAPRGFEQVYDPQTIIAAAGLLGEKAEFKIDMLGDNSEAEIIEERIENKSLSDIINVKPMLPHDEFASLLKNYDIYLSASLSDSTSVALLEAMTVGLFPVVSDIEGNREWIEDGINGVTFEPGSAEALAEALARAKAMRNKFETASQINRDRVAREAVWQDNMDRFKEIMLGLIGHE